MIDRDVHQRTVEEIVPVLFESIKRDFQYPTDTNLAASDQCHVLTKGLHIALSTHGLDVRREFHQDDDVWHYVIAHSPEGSEPREDDIITDLNPWQFMKRNMPPTYTYLHGERSEIMECLRKEGAPEYFIALRGLATVQKAHTLASNDYM